MKIYNLKSLYYIWPLTTDCSKNNSMEALNTECTDLPFNFWRSMCSLSLSDFFSTRNSRHVIYILDIKNLKISSNCAKISC